MRAFGGEGERSERVGAPGGALPETVRRANHNGPEARSTAIPKGDHEDDPSRPKHSTRRHRHVDHARGDFNDDLIAFGAERLGARIAAAEASLTTTGQRPEPHRGQPPQQPIHPSCL